MAQKSKKVKKEMLSSTYEVLTSKGFLPDKGLEARRMMVTAEKGKKYSLAVTDGKESALFQVDGNIITEGLKCDKLILVKLGTDERCETWAEVFVELKGTDVQQAIDQLRTTIANKIFSHSSNKEVRARIVAVSFPSNKANPMMEKAKREFAKVGCDLRGIKTGQVDSI